jgi:hypothetical protein
MNFYGYGFLLGILLLPVSSSDGGCAVDTHHSGKNYQPQIGSALAQESPSLGHHLTVR